jgi:hypothetical protein
MNDISPRFFNQVSQLAHVSTTYAIAFTCGHRWGARGLISSSVIIFAYALVHEFIWDPRMENMATRGSDLEDFLYLCAGPILAALIWSIP